MKGSLTCVAIIIMAASQFDAPQLWLGEDQYRN